MVGRSVEASRECAPLAVVVSATLFSLERSVFCEWTERMAATPSSGGGGGTNDRHVKFKEVAPLPVQIPGSPRADGSGPHSSASTQPPSTPHNPSATPSVSTPHTPGAAAPATPHTPATPYTPGGHPVRRASFRDGETYDPVKVLRDRALRRMNGNKVRSLARFPILRIPFRTAPSQAL